MALVDMPLEQLKSYLPQRQEPADFDAFWEQTLAESRAFPLDARFELVDVGLKTVEVYDVTLNVVADGHAPFEVVHRQMIAAAALGNWQVGKMLPVRFDPANPTQVTIG